MLIGTIEGRLARLADATATEVDLLDTPFSDVGRYLAGGGRLEDLKSVAVVERRPLDVAAFGCPLVPGAAIWGVGLNYHCKARRTGRPTPDDPILYVKPTSALAGPGDDVRVPAEPSEQLDYEAEVAIVIGAPLDNVSPSAAWAGVAGITAANDLTGRDIMKRVGNPGLAKGFPGFSPIGPVVRPATELSADFDLAVRSFVNGEARQDGRTGDFIFTVTELLSRISRFTTLQPGDVVLTGTPAGTGDDLGNYLQPGDEVVVDVESLLPLRNRLVARN